MKDIYYHMVRWLARMAVCLFYNPIEINGLDNIPKKSGHLIFAPNHQSAFLDAILVAVFSTKPIFFLTRSDVFKFPFKYFLYSLNMMPVYRKRDGYKTLSKNEAVFQTCKQLVQSGRPILLFPEASQELVHYLRPLSRGLSRIAQLCQKDFDQEVYIIPVGLNYFNHLRGGTKLIINFGKPLNVRDYLDKHPDKTTAINAIREASSAAIKSEMLIPDYDDAYEEKVAYLNRNYYDYSFTEMKQLLSSPVLETAKQAGRQVWLIIPAILLEIVNLPYFLIKHSVIAFLVKDKTFYASIKLALLMFLLPVYLMLSFVFFEGLWNYFLATVLVLLQLAALRQRFKLEKYLV